MSDTIIAALIAAFVAILTNVISNAFTSSKTNALINYRLGELEKKVDKHNNVLERTMVLEQSVASTAKQIDEIHEDIQRIERKVFDND